MKELFTSMLQALARGEGVVLYGLRRGNLTVSVGLYLVFSQANDYNGEKIRSVNCFTGSSLPHYQVFLTGGL